MENRNNNRFWSDGFIIKLNKNFKNELFEKENTKPTFPLIAGNRMTQI